MFFSKLDIRSGYWKVQIEKMDKLEVAFKVGAMDFFNLNKLLLDYALLQLRF